VRILFDQGVPVPLRKQLTGHEVTTCKEKGWDQITNGDLITQAETLFDVFVSTDQNLKYQQNLKTGRLRFWFSQQPAGANLSKMQQRSSRLWID